MDKKTLILNCARKRFLEQGYKSTSIQSIADEAGISKGAVYLYFNAKEDILLAIFRMLEEKVWAEIARINCDEALSDKEKFRLQIITFYNEIMENLQFNQMMLSESGVALNEAFYSYAREYRYKLQKVQEASLLKIYGNKITPWISDLVVAINGIMKEFDASIILDNLQIECEELADFVCNVTDFMANGILEKSPKPIFSDQTRLVREEFLAQVADGKTQAVKDTLKEILDELHELSLSVEETKTAEETLSLLKDAISASKINKTLIKALVSNLKPYKTLRKSVTQLLNQLDID